MDPDTNMRKINKAHGFQPTLVRKRSFPFLRLLMFCVCICGLGVGGCYLLQTKKRSNKKKTIYPMACPSGKW